jgi:predicted TIM-barrel enzyme
MTSGPAHNPAPPDDPELLKEQIEQTREHLGETVEELAAKADVKARAQETAADLRQRAKDTISQVRRQAVAAGETGRVRVSKAAVPLWDATPDSVKQAVSKGTSGARQYRKQLAIVAGVLVAGAVVVRWWTRR